MLTKLIAVVPDNTETYFVMFSEIGGWDSDIHRRVAMLIYESDKVPGTFVVFMDETGRIHLYDETVATADELYDQFTVGFEKVLTDVRFLKYFKDQEFHVYEIFKKLKRKNIVFQKPEGNDVNIILDFNYKDRSFRYWISDETAWWYNHLPHGWEEAIVPGDNSQLYFLGRQLALMRYVLDIPSLYFNFDFHAVGPTFTEEDWQEWCGMDCEEMPETLQERLLRDTRNEQCYLERWEEIIEQEAKSFTEECEDIEYWAKIDGI